MICVTRTCAFAAARQHSLPSSIRFRSCNADANPQQVLRRIEYGVGAASPIFGSRSKALFLEPFRLSHRIALHVKNDAGDAPRSLPSQVSRLTHDSQAALDEIFGKQGPFPSSHFYPFSSSNLIIGPSPTSRLTRRLLPLARPPFSHKQGAAPPALLSILSLQKPRHCPCSCSR